MTYRWYAVQTAAGHEKKVCSLLLQRIADDARPAEEKLVRRALVPTQEVIEIKNGKKVLVERKLYPGYVLIESQHQMWAAQFCLTRSNRTWLSSGGAGTMGFGFPAAIGAQFAHPKKKVWAVVGDSGFQMTCSELATATVNKLPVKCLIINNNYLGMIRQWQEMFYENRLSGADLEGNPDFVRLAQAYGTKAFRIRRPADVNRVLREAHEYADGPCVVVAEVVKEDNVFPMIPAGASIAEMLIEKPRHRLAKPEGSS